MNSSLLLILATLAVLALIVAAKGFWQHEKIISMFSFGLALLFGGTLLNVVALRHVDQSGAVYSWATLPSWTYSTPLWAAMVLMVFAGLGKLPSAWRNRRKPAAG